jgi:hypothetical protein
MKRATAALFALTLWSPAALADAPPAPVGTAPAALPAAETATCVFKVVHASQGPSPSMDPAINMLREDLKRPPFTAWNTFKVMARNQADLAKGATATFRTPDGHTAVLTYAGHLPRKDRHAIKAVLDLRGSTSAARTTLTLDEGGHFVVAGHKYQGGILIYAITCKTHG